MILVIENFTAAAFAGKKAALSFERISAAEAAEICYASKDKVVSAVSDPNAARTFTDILGCRIECFSEIPSLNLEKDTLLLGELILGKYPLKDIYFKHEFHVQWFLIKKI